jgi:hypothetical protein
MPPTNSATISPNAAITPTMIKTIFFVLIKN